jgi:hypothetical protein
MVIVQVRARSGEVFAREECRDQDEALRVAMSWVTILVEDAADPLEALAYLPAIEVLPDPRAA